MAQQFEYVNSALWGNIRCVDIDGDYAYCAFNAGLVVLDISNPGSITEISKLYLPGSSNWIDVENDLAFISNYDHGLDVVDISDPPHPELISQYSSPKKASGVQVDGDYAYLKTSDSVSTTFEFIDISDPRHPTGAGSYTLNDDIYSNMYAVDTLAYVASYQNGLIILNIANPVLPDTLSISQPGYSCYRVKVKGDYAYLTGSTADGPPYGAFFVMKIDDPRNPYQTFIEQAYDPYGNLAISNNVLYVQYSEDCRITIWDLAEPASPDYLGFYFPFGDANYGFRVYNDKAYFPLTLEGLEVVNMQNPASPVYLGAFDLPYGVTGSLGYDDYLVCNTLSDGSFIFDVSDPHNLGIVSNIDMHYARNFRIENYLYLVRYGGRLYIFDLTDPQEPILTDSLAMQSVDYLENYGDAVYMQGIFDNWDRFLILDSSDPAHPVIEDTVVTPYSRLNSLYVNDHYLFLPLGDDLSPGFIAYDIADPFDPFLTCYCHTDYQIGGLAFKGNYAFANVSEPLENIYQILIFDISNMNEPELVSTIEMSDGIRWPFIYGDFMFMGGGNQDVVIYNIAEPLNPVPVDTIFTGAWNAVADINFYHDYIYLSMRDYLLILSWSPAGIEETGRLPLAYSTLASYPNPFNASTTISYTLPKQSQVTLGIYDILGRKVTSLYSGKQESGEHSVIWNAEGFASGIYLYKLTAGEFEQSAKMMLVK